MEPRIWTYEGLSPLSAAGSQVDFASWRAFGSEIVSARALARPSGEPPEARTSIIAANAERAPAFSTSLDTRSLTAIITFVLIPQNCLSVIEGEFFLLRSSSAKRSLITVSTSTGTVAYTSASTAVRFSRVAPTTAALLAA